MINNYYIAKIFNDIADMLEIKKDNVFKIQAYRKGANNIKSLEYSLQQTYKDNLTNLSKVAGVGKDLEKKIIEILETGTLEYYNLLVKEFPCNFLDLLKISGLGPKKLRKIKEHYDIKNINDLEHICKKGLLRNIEGMGEKTEIKFLLEIEYIKKQQNKILLVQADIYVDKIIDYLFKSEFFKRIEKIGELRRGKESIENISILIGTIDKEKAITYITNYEDVKNVTHQTNNIYKIKTKQGYTLDFIVTDLLDFEIKLFYYTGNKQHVLQIQKIAKQKQYQLDEKGFFLNNKKINNLTEKEIYSKLGMQFIPAELRENTGEIEKAQKHNIPKNLITLNDIKGDLHIHTNDSDGECSVKEMILKAKEKGYKYIAITNHSQNVRIANGMNEEQVLKHIEKVKKISSTIKGIDVLLGMEVDILEHGDLDLKDYVLKELDIVIIAVHSRFSLNREKQTMRIVKALENKYVNILAHPSGRLISTRRGIDVDFDKIFKQAINNNVCLEINTHGERIDLNDINAKKAKQMGAKFSINTDSHSIAHLDLIKYGVITARRAYLEREDIINTYNIEKLKNILSKK